MLRCLPLVFRGAAAVEQAAMHFRMERLDASAEHFRPAGEIGNVAHGDSRFAQQLGGSAGRKNLDLQRGQALGEIHNPGLVKHADQSALHRHGCLHNEKREQCKWLARIGEVQTTRGATEGAYDFTRAFSLTWPSITSTTYSTSRQFFCFCNSFVFFSTNSLKLERESFPVSSPAVCLACRNAWYNCSTFSVSRSGSEQVMRNALDSPAAAAATRSSVSFFERAASISLAAAPKCR